MPEQAEQGRADGGTHRGTIAEAVRPYFDRPFLVLDAHRFAVACRAAVTDSWLRGLRPIGSVDQIAGSTDVLAAIGHARLLRALYAT